MFCFNILNIVSLYLLPKFVKAELDPYLALI